MRLSLALTSFGFALNATGFDKNSVDRNPFVPRFNTVQRREVDARAPVPYGPRKDAHRRESARTLSGVA